MSAPVAVRAAGPADREAIAAVFLACWRETYRGVIPDAAIARWDDESAGRLWEEAIAAPDTSVAVAESDGAVAGVVRFGRDPDDPARGHVASLYVAPSHAGAGIGRRLLEHAEGELAAAGHATATLWVFEANAAAVAFYRRCGWIAGGRTRIEPEYGEPEVELVRMLGPGSRMRSEMAEQPALLEALLGRRPEIVAALAAAAPDAPRGVIMVARGSSDNAAVYGRYAIELALRRPVSLAAPSLWTRYGLTEDLDGYVAVAASQSGRTPEIVTMLESLRTAGATAFAITNDGESPLAEAAHATVELGAGEERAIPATKTVGAQLAAFAFVAEALGDAPWSVSDWDALAPAQRALLADGESAAGAATVIAAGDGSVHLGRGALFAVALESALKLTETSLTQAIAHSSADFLHGPVAMARRETPVVAYVAPGPVARDVERATAAARAAGTPLVLVGEQGAPGALHVPVPAGIAEWLSPLVHVVRAQQLAAEVTFALGGDPDRPRGLNKITLTD